MDRLGGEEKKKNKRLKKESHPQWGGLFYITLLF